VHQRWRQIVLTSPLALNIRLYCTYGTPVWKTLDCWPALPIIVQYGGAPHLRPPPPKDDDNIITALKQSDRVSSISLTITSSLLKKLSVISEPFSKLEELTLMSSLMSQDTMEVTIPSTFQCGPRLRSLHITSIAFPSFPHLLLPSQVLVDLRLHEIPSNEYFSPQAFANALSGMTQLQSLSLSFPRRRSYLDFPPSPGERISLPALTSLKYRGTSKYLDTLAAGIDAPTLGDIDITLFNQPALDASRLGQFIGRTEIPTSLTRAEIQTSAHAISMFFIVTGSGSGTSTPLQLHISCQELDSQLSCMAQVCNQFSPFLFRVYYLGLKTTQSLSEQGDMAREQWLQLVRPFNCAREFRVAGELTNDILRALSPADGDYTTVLPALRYLFVENPMAVNEPSWGALLLFVTSRSRSGRPVQVNVPLSECHICHAMFRRQNVLDRHLKDEHGYRTLCSYCDDFECTPGGHDLFREHLNSKHREVWLKEASNFDHRFSHLSYLGSVFKIHSSLRAR
jgi:hypothetical protein